MAELQRRDVVLIIAAVPNVACRQPHHLIRLSGVDLSGLDLSGLNLANADLAGANLAGCNLTDANLASVDLSSADLTGAVLRGVYAEGATFIDAKLPGADFTESQRNCFYGTHLLGTSFDGADLTGAKMCRVRLWGARFCDATLVKTDFSGAQANAKTLFTRADMTGAILDAMEWGDVPSLAQAQTQSAAADHPAIAKWSRLKLAV